jgi:hypothetical protein
VTARGWLGVVVAAGVVLVAGSGCTVGFGEPPRDERGVIRDAERARQRYREEQERLLFERQFFPPGPSDR